MKKIRLSLLVFIIIIISILTIKIYGYDPKTMVFEERSMAPSLKHWMGTDHAGRDLLARVAYGVLTTLEISLLGLFFAALVGVTLGGLCGYYFGTWIDSIFLRIMEIFLSVPPLLSMMAMCTMFSAKTPLALGIVLGSLSWMTIARLTRIQFATLKTASFVEISALQGNSRFYILFSELLPNAFGPICIAMLVTLPSLIMTESTLAFLGLNSKNPSLGIILYDFIQYAAFQTGAWWQFVFPGLAIIGIVYTFFYLSEGLQEYFNPRLAQK